MATIDFAESLKNMWQGGKTGFTVAIPPNQGYQHRKHFWQDARLDNAEMKSVAGNETVREPLWSGKGPAYAVGYGAGRMAGDITGEVTRGKWWRYNHPLGITYKVGEDVAYHSGFQQQRGGEKRVHPHAGALYGFGLATLANVASGNFDLQNLDAAGRPRGYSAIFADPEDPTQSKMPLAEPIAGWILGSRHKLLPYERFTQERPDVSPQTYLNYQQYQSWGKPAFFGLERADPVFTGGAGALVGAALTKNKKSISALGKNLAIGSVLGAVTPGITRGVSGLGVIKGTWSNLDQEPEAQLLGYKMPLSAIATTALGGVGLYALGKRMNRPKPPEFEQMSLDL